MLTFNQDEKASTCSESYKYIKNCLTKKGPFKERRVGSDNVNQLLSYIGRRNFPSCGGGMRRVPASASESDTVEWKDSK